MSIERLTLTDFRTYASMSLEASPGFVLLYGDNGAGKTNLLEAVSMLAPGRGLRGARISDMARRSGGGSWAVAATVGGSELGTGTVPSAPERRQVRVNGSGASVNSLSEWLAVLWLTPAMDRLFSGTAGERRRFLDRLVLAIDPAHAYHSSRYEAAMRERNKLLAESAWDEHWLASLERAMADHGLEIASGRMRTVTALQDHLASVAEDDFPRSSISLEGWIDGDDLEPTLSASRRRDAAAGRTVEGPHRQDLVVNHAVKNMPAAQSSTGEQKALLLGLVLAHAELVAQRRKEPPILLLDEVAAHLDPRRRDALFERLAGRGQIWMTATEASLFDGIRAAPRLHVTSGAVTQA